MQAEVARVEALQRQPPDRMPVITSIHLRKLFPSLGGTAPKVRAAPSLGIVNFSRPQVAPTWMRLLPHFCWMLRLALWWTVVVRRGIRLLFLVFPLPSVYAPLPSNRAAFLLSLTAHQCLACASSLALPCLAVTASNEHFSTSSIT
eukprot:1161213-Pelagomonas_calceolata.AAC.14